MSEENNIPEDAAPDTTSATEDITPKPTGRGKKKPTKEVDELDIAIRQGKIAEQKKQQNKKRMIIGGVAGGLLLLGYGIFLLFAPYKGGTAYGVCRVFLELNVEYPDLLHIMATETLGSSERIWYMQTDSFGQSRMETVQCYFDNDKPGTFLLRKIKINRQEVPQEVVDRFNVSVPVVLKNLPDLTIPGPLPNNLRGLQFDTDMYRKQIFNKRK